MSAERNAGPDLPVHTTHIPSPVSAKQSPSRHPVRAPARSCLTRQTDCADWRRRPLPRQLPVRRPPPVRTGRARPPPLRAGSLLALVRDANAPRGATPATFAATRDRAALSTQTMNALISSVGLLRTEKNLLLVKAWLRSLTAAASGAIAGLSRSSHRKPVARGESGAASLSQTRTSTCRTRTSRPVVVPGWP